jgi:hypothetical protein
MARSSALLRSNVDTYRRFTKEYAPGVGGCSRKPVNE